MFKLAYLASHHSETLPRILQRLGSGVECAIVVSDDPDAGVLSTANTHGLSTVVVDAEDELPRICSDYDIDLVCLEEYNQTVSDQVIDALPNAIDVHYSLLPSFPGSNPIEKALEQGVCVTGCSVYALTPTDNLPIVTQEPIPVFPDDTIANVTGRLREEAVGRAYPRAIQLFVDGRVTVTDADVSVNGLNESDVPSQHFVSTDHLRNLRYGENPHQNAAVYVDSTVTETNVVNASQLNPNAKALSYNNYNDADGALNLIKEFDEPAAAVIKHTNPAGCAVATSIEEAYDKALSTDPMSAFGGIVTLNRQCNTATAEQVINSFKEVIIAPNYTDEALSVLTEKENLRILEVGEFTDITERRTEKPLIGGRLIQDRDLLTVTEDDLEIVTERTPNTQQIETMLFAWRVIKHVKSNAILFAKGTETVGIGMGQVSRVDAVKLAAMKAEEHAEGKTAENAVMASDAFFPFPDGIEEAVNAGITSVIQPGGSVNDESVIDAANDHDIAMVFTGTRSFRHD